MLRPHLLCWLVIPNLRSTAIAGGIALLWTVFSQEPLHKSYMPGLGIFVLVHSVAVVHRSASSPVFGYLYSRGFPWRVLWWHTMAASLMSVLLVWGVAALMVCLPIRSFVQETLFGNPWYPIMIPHDTAFILFALAMYLVVLPIMHYAWIREAQPVRHAHTALWPLLSFLVLLPLLTAAPQVLVQRASWSWAALGAVAVSVTLLIAGYGLHQRLEVRS